MSEQVETELHADQLRMLRIGQFHVDGWVRLELRQLAADLEKRGLVTSFVTESEQYTAVNFDITPAGRQALAAAEKPPA